MGESSQVALREGRPSTEWQIDALFLIAGLVMLSLGARPPAVDVIAGGVAGSLGVEWLTDDDESETLEPTLPLWLRLRLLAFGLFVVLLAIDLGLFFSMRTTGSVLVGLSVPALLRTVAGEIRSTR